MNMYNPYIMPMQQTQDLGGLSPVYQNIAAQQAMQNAALQQGMNLTNQAGMTVDGKQAGAGYDQIAMANALRRQQDQQKIDMANAEMSAFNQRPAQNYYSAGMNPNDIISDMDY
tara:strand:+ start:936 stop:1277 length:342 start_codon:yes stop_codon:yes gene_type:complete